MSEIEKMKHECEEQKGHCHQIIKYIDWLVIFDITYSVIFYCPYCGKKLE